MTTDGAAPMRPHWTLDDIAALADRVDRLTVALRGLAAHLGADIHVDLDGDGLIDAMTRAGEDPDEVARG